MTLPRSLNQREWKAACERASTSAPVARENEATQTRRARLHGEKTPAAIAVDRVARCAVRNSGVRSAILELSQHHLRELPILHLPGAVLVALEDHLLRLLFGHRVADGLHHVHELVRVDGLGVVPVEDAEGLHDLALRHHRHLEEGLQLEELLEIG